MPYKTEKLAIKDPFMDRRTKLLPCQKQMVKYWRAVGYSQRQLAKMFKVSRRLIQFTIDEDKHKENLKRRDERGGTKQYYNREKHNEYMKKHRKDKHKRLKEII